MRYNLNHHHQQVNTRNARVNLVIFVSFFTIWTALEKNCGSKLWLDEPWSKLLWNKPTPHSTVILPYLKDFKGVASSLLQKKNFVNNLLTPMSSKMSMSFFLSSVEKKWRFLMKTFQHFSPYIMDFNGNQTVQGLKDSFSANCKLFKGL